MRIISGKYGRRRFEVPHNITARPTTDMARESLFNVLGGIVDFDGIVALDLFAGTGAISFELLSRGAASVTAIERATVQQRFITSVATRLDEHSLTLVRGDVFKFLSSCRQAFDLVFADPPYDLPQLGDLPRLIMESGVVKRDTLVVLEHPREFDFTTLPQFSQHRNYGKVNFSFFKV